MLEDEKRHITNENSKDLLNETWEEQYLKFVFKPTYRRKALEILTVMNQVKSDFKRSDYDTLYSGLMKYL